MIDRLRQSATLWAQGGLGNQLFQYNAARNLTEKNGVQLLVSKSSYGRDRLRDFELSRLLPVGSELTAIEERLAGQPYNWRGHARTLSPLSRLSFKFAGERIDGDLFNSGTVNVGFFQETAWLELDTNEIRSQLAPVRKEIEGQNLIPPGTLILHVRRGDYATSDSARRVFGVLSRSYYEDACALLGRSIDEAMIFTDDTDAVRHEFGVDRERIIGPSDIKSPLDTMLAMSLASELIIPNSTFSWWAAELAANIPVAAPRTWFLDREHNLRRDTWATVANS